jgi:hypothetical protein
VISQVIKAASLSTEQRSSEGNLSERSQTCANFFKVRSQGPVAICRRLAEARTTEISDVSKTAALPRAVEIVSLLSDLRD